MADYPYGGDRGPVCNEIRSIGSSSRMNCELLHRERHDLHVRKDVGRDTRKEETGSISEEQEDRASKVKEHRHGEFTFSKTPREFFSIGRVFVVQWARSSDTTASLTAWPKDPFERTRGVNRDNVACNASRFVVLAKHRGHYVGMHVKTYAGQNNTPETIELGHHAIAFFGSAPPPKHPFEGVRIDSRTCSKSVLDPMSRLRYGTLQSWNYSKALRHSENSGTTDVRVVGHEDSVDLQKHYNVPWGASWTTISRDNIIAAVHGMESLGIAPTVPAMGTFTPEPFKQSNIVNHGQHLDKKRTSGKPGRNLRSILLSITSQATIVWLATSAMPLTMAQTLKPNNQNVNIRRIKEFAESVTLEQESRWLIIFDKSEALSGDGLGSVTLLIALFSELLVVYNLRPYDRYKSRAVGICMTGILFACGLWKADLRQLILLEWLGINVTILVSSVIHARLSKTTPTGANAEEKVQIEGW